MITAEVKEFGKSANQAERTFAEIKKLMMTFQRIQAAILSIRDSCKQYKKAFNVFNHYHLTNIPGLKTSPVKTRIRCELKQAGVLK